MQLGRAGVLEHILERRLLFEHRTVVGRVHVGTMDSANPSPSGRTGHINEVAEVHHKTLAARTLAPLHDWLMR